MMVWEGHKCYIRGELIRMGAKRKRDGEKVINDLTNKILELESQHKQSLSEKHAGDLLEARKALQQLMTVTAKRFLFFKKKIYYEAGDKSGKLLTRALRDPHSSTHISGIRNDSGILDVKTEDIAAHFHTYYSKLYNLPSQHRPPGLEGTEIKLYQTI